MGSHTCSPSCMHPCLHIIKSSPTPRGQNTLRAQDAMPVLFRFFLYFKTKGGDGGERGWEGVVGEMRECW